jgi:hypothetical protein
MAAPSHPFQSHGFQTSVDMARATAHGGLKRPHQGVDHDVHRTGHEPYHHGSMTADISVRTQGNPNQQHRPRQRPVDFVRASSATPRACIAASEIRLAFPAGQLPSERSQAAVAAPEPPPPPVTQNPLLSLQHPRYGLPAALVANFAAVGIRSIYPWQATCLLGRGHLTGEKNLLYTAPTGGGKSLVADVLMLRRIIEHPHRKAILVLPYVALVQEKLKWLRRLVQDVDKRVADLDPSTPGQPWKQTPKAVRVTGFFGGSKSRSTWADTDIAVCTIEKVRGQSPSPFRRSWVGYLSNPRRRQMPW